MLCISQIYLGTSNLSPQLSMSVSTSCLSNKSKHLILYPNMSSSNCSSRRILHCSNVSPGQISTLILDAAFSHSLCNYQQVQHLVLSLKFIPNLTRCPLLRQPKLSPYLLHIYHCLLNGLLAHPLSSLWVISLIVTRKILF